MLIAQVCEFTALTGMTVLQAVLGMLSLICLVMSGILCLREKEGWGWFLFVALLFGGLASDMVLK